ncbi:MAG: hypothetical protein M3R15_34645 [Acidobacteriota bacterium]|nr:hypothetical protein [Acidobacteriota bacterium]
MHVIDEDELFLAGNHGENITVSLRSDNTVHMVTYDLDGVTGVVPQTGPQSGELVFPLDQPANDPSKLTLVFHFANSGGTGGIYRVLVKGSQGGDTFGRLFKQHSSPVTAKRYTFDVI